MPRQNKHHQSITSLALLSMFLLTAVVNAEVADTPVKIQWQAVDITGQKVTLNADGKPTVLAFVMADQKRSRTAVEYLRRVLGDAKDMQVVAVISGDTAQVDAPRFVKEMKWTGRTVADPQYETSGKFHVRVWPTLVIVDPDGKLLGHIAGLPSTLSKDLAAYLDYARGDIDEPTFQKQLHNHQSVTNSKDQIADRHWQVAQRLLDARQLDQAAMQIELGLKAKPHHANLLLLRARMLLYRGQAKQAMAQLDALPADALPGWRVQTVRGRVLVALAQWDKAAAVLSDAVKLNPQPAEAQYFLGRVHEHQGNWQAAAKAYRFAVEHDANSSVHVGDGAK